MPRRDESPAAILTADVSERLRDVVGNAVLLGVVALFAVTVWIVSIAGLIALLAPLWGTASAFFIVALLVIVFAVVLLAVLRQRSRDQRARADIRRAETRAKGQAALLASLPGLLRKRSGALVLVSGLAIGAMIVAALDAEGDE